MVVNANKLYVLMFACVPVPGYVVVVATNKLYVCIFVCVCLCQATSWWLPPTDCLYVCVRARAPAPGHVVVVAATNRPNALDPALRRPGRLDREVVVPVPGARERAAILRLHTHGLQVCGYVSACACVRVSVC